MKHITIFEHSWYSFEKEDLESFKKIVEFNEKNNSRYFHVGINKIKSTQFVGILANSEFTLEILPKLSKGDSEKLPWRELLVEMLFVVKDIKIHRALNGLVGHDKRSILDIYLILFLEEVERIKRLGFVKKYNQVEGNIRKVKGAINFSKTLSLNNLRKDKHYCSYANYDKNNVYNCALFEVLRLIPSLTNSIDITLWTKRLTLDFDGIEGLGRNQYTSLKSLVYDRKTIAYKGALDLAKIILNLDSPNFKIGENNFITLLFDMNDIFEKYVAKMLSKSIKKEVSFLLQIQSNKKFWEFKKIKPDLVIHFQNNTYVLDTKWKLPDLKSPSDSDLKQIFVYNEYYKSDVGVLLYPSCELGSIKDVSGQYHVNNKNCHMVFLNLFMNGKVNTQIGDDLIQKIMKLKMPS